MNLDARARRVAALSLGLLVAVTHGQHDLTALHLPPATWAAFFLGGLLLQRAGWWVLGLALVGLLDTIAIRWGGVSDFCISPAYLFMIPAYGTLWFAGRKASRHLHWQLRHGLVVAACLGSILIAETLASGSFYLFSGKVAQAGLAGLPAYLVTWAPATLEAFAFWMGASALAGGALLLLRGAGVLPRRSA
ncbi:MAG: hypothetical protein KGM40_03835 [Betaproteobacteria bacterium]|nr:hypothetical protein [Betaproteobacteria bacterium]